MYPIFGQPCRQLSTTMVLQHGYAGGVVGNNLPFKNGMKSTMRFTLFYLIAGVVGFGAPWLVVRHQMLRNVTAPPPPPPDEVQ